MQLHAKGKKHISNIKGNKKQREINTLLQVPKIPNNISSLEIKLAGFVSEHNLSFSIIDHLTNLLKESVTDSNIIQRLNLGRTKLTSIIKNVIAPEHKLYLTKILKETKFSILTDESTDISCKKASCIVVRFYDKTSQQIKSFLWELVQVFSENQSNEGATAEHLYQAIIVSFQNQVPLNNIIGSALMDAML